MGSRTIHRKLVTMRINVYAEELTTETELVTKVVTDEEFGERTFYGIRMFLKSPTELHHSAEDDDRSAITFWVKWTRKGGTDPFTLSEMLHNLLTHLDQVTGYSNELVPNTIGVFGPHSNSVPTFQDDDGTEDEQVPYPITMRPLATVSKDLQKLGD